MATPTTISSYYGGKSMTIGKRIAGRIGDIQHVNYVEPFGGMAGVLMAKRPSKIEVYNDLSAGLVTLFRVVRTRPAELEAALRLTPYARAEFVGCSESYRSGQWLDLADDPVEQARQVFVMLDMSFNGTMRNGGWSFGGPKHDSNVAQTFYNHLAKFEPISRRLQNVLIECQDAFEIIRRWDGPQTLFYLDPPYVLETRSTKTKGKYYYEYEMQNEQHEALIELVLGLKGKVLLSGYDHPIYNQLVEAGWALERYSATASSCVITTNNGRKKKTFDPDHAKRVECLWVNPQANVTRSLWDSEVTVA